MGSQIRTFRPSQTSLLPIDTMGHIPMANTSTTTILGPRSNHARELETFLGMDTRPMEPQGKTGSARTSRTG